MERAEEINHRLGEIQDEPLKLGNDDSRRPSSGLIQELKQLYRQMGSLRNQSIDEGTGRATVEQRISHLEAILKERGHL